MTTLMISTKGSNQFILLLFWAFILSFCLSCCALGVNISSHKNVMCLNHEREALLRFKQGINHDDCGLLSSWGNPNENCCEWRGISCSNHTGHVIKLNLRDPSHYNLWGVGCLQGKVGSSLVDLKHLVYLDLSFNDFTDQPFPSFIGSMVSLKFLNLSKSGFVGEIPPHLGNLTRLSFLDLSSDDDYNGLIVTSLSWLSRLKMLKYIKLSGVDLSKATDWLKYMNNLPLLREIHLDFCSLSSNFLWPLVYTNKSTTLSFVNLQGNSIKNTLIFEWLFNNFSRINTLSYLDLSHNDLGGTIPSRLRDLEALSYLDLSYNEFGGTFPSGLRDLETLSYLDLTGNNFRGYLPDGFLNTKSLSYLSLSMNSFEGPVPDTISTINTLVELDFSFNKFTVLPKTLGNLCNLEKLELSNNNLGDELAVIIQSLTGCASKTLLFLHLSANQVSGPIPDIIGMFSSLTELYLDSNLLNGTISKNLGELSMLETLHLNDNNLKGTLSHNHLLNLSRLRELYLSNNPSLVINIDANQVPPFQLEDIRLSSCILGPKFPMWLVTQKNYSYLDISVAGISDRIPKSFSTALPSNLYHLNISCNKIHGPLPEFSGSLISDDIEIDLSFNIIDGKIPLFPYNVISLKLNDNKFSDPTPFLCPQSKINISNLDLSNNLLSGKLPDCWTNLDHLSTLHLENNYFSGPIPPSMGHLNELEALHLYNNTFSGAILRLFENLTSLIILDLSHNSFTGHIPSTIGNHLTSLSFLSLRTNRIVGAIPLSLCRMSYLQVLDLSDNEMTGSIPNCISNITGMRNGTSLMPELQYDTKYHQGALRIGTSYIPYSDTATIMWKRKEWRISSSLGLVKAISLSNNKFEGEIPVEMFILIGLVSLDLSRNNLTGSIKPEIGQLTALEFLDLSNNQLVGEIPQSFSDMNFLGILDLSNNHLSGKIPQGTLLQGFNATVYAGNAELCGLPLPLCPWDQSPHINGGDSTMINHQDENGSNDIFPGLYISVILGFIIGFWGVCGTLVLNGPWRRAFFQFFEDVRNKLCVAVCVRV